jgi:hypothetical protein
MEKAKSPIGIIIAVAVAILLGAVLVVIMAEQTNLVSQKTNVFNENHTLVGCWNATGPKGQVDELKTGCNITVTNAPTSWKTENCPITSVVVMNATTSAKSTAVESTDYNLFDTTGIVQLLNTTFWEQNNVTNRTQLFYTYCGDNYVDSSWGRTVLNMTPGFFILGILIGTAFVIFWVLKREGVELDV